MLGMLEDDVDFENLVDDDDIEEDVDDDDDDDDVNDDIASPKEDLGEEGDATDLEDEILTLEADADVETGAGKELFFVICWWITKLEIRLFMISFKQKRC